MIIGQIIAGEKLELDLPTLVDTRLLIQANSGGGKSWLLRLIAERAGIQTIVLDNEGEFASLREAVDMLLVGASGELPANPRQAALLARRLIEYKVSAVIDLYELKLAERRQFVKLFLESLIHLPRELWRPTLVILDEFIWWAKARATSDKTRLSRRSDSGAGVPTTEASAPQIDVTLSPHFLRRLRAAPAVTSESC